MLIKRIYLTILFFLLAVSSAQIFSIPPYAGDIETIYKSGYFSELDRGFDVIAESFLALKTMSRPEYGWIYLRDIGEKQKIDARVFDNSGFEIPAPGTRVEQADRSVAESAVKMKGRRVSGASAGKYSSLVPLHFEARCLICHKKSREGEQAGYLKFTRAADSMVYYSAERAALFSVISLLIAGLVFLTMRWDPHRNVKDLFDK